jgi:hypothetical protein
MTTTFSLSNTSICSPIVSRPTTLRSTTFNEVLRLEMAFVMDLFLLPPDLVTGITCPLMVGCSFSPSGVVWIDCGEGVGENFLYLLLLWFDLHYWYRFFIYFHYLLILGDPRSELCVIALYTINFLIKCVSLRVMLVEC